MREGKATVLMPGTCGELVQGTRDGVHFLVSCPVDMFSEVTVELTGNGRRVAPPHLPKTVAAVETALRFFGCPRLGFRLEVNSPIPRGKGMGSSTADVAGAVYAVAQALGREISLEDAARLCLAIEPTNSSLFPNIALFDHRTGSLCQELGPPPPIDILALDFGGEVDTLSYNSVDRSALLKQLEPQAAQALEMVRTGLAQGDASLIGRGATISARAHQRVLYKPQLEAVIALAEEVGGLGVSVGHSGTIIGVLLDPARPSPDWGRARHHRDGVAAYLRSKLDGLQHIHRCRLISGGCRQPREARKGSATSDSFPSPLLQRRGGQRG